MISKRICSMRSIVFLFLASALFLSLVSCGIDWDEANAFINDFLETIETGNYEKAEIFLHPERPADLEEFFTGVESEENLDFQAGITVEQCSNISSAYYDNLVNGSTYELTLKAKIGERDAKITIEIVQNDNGYGIYNFEIDPAD